MIVIFLLMVLITSKTVTGAQIKQNKTVTGAKIMQNKTVTGAQIRQNKTDRCSNYATEQVAYKTMKILKEQPYPVHWEWQIFQHLMCCTDDA